MAGYSGTPLSKKLGIKPGSQVTLVDAPAGFERTLGALPDAASFAAEPASDGIVVLFTQSRAGLEPRFLALARAVAPAGSLWVAWPKRSSGVPTDLTEDTLREVCLPAGLVDNKVCAIDDTWSGLRFVWRKELRPSLRPNG